MMQSVSLSLSNKGKNYAVLPGHNSAPWCGLWLPGDGPVPSQTLLCPRRLLGVRWSGCNLGTSPVRCAPGAANAPGELGFINWLIGSTAGCPCCCSLSPVSPVGQGDGSSWLRQVYWEILISSGADGTEETSSPRHLFLNFDWSVMTWLCLL